MTPDLYHPVLDCFVRGLPHVYRDVDVPVGTVPLLEISGECGGQWFLSRESTRWNFLRQSAREFACRVTIPQELAWRAFTKGIDRDSARAHIAIEGNRDLGERVLHLTDDYMDVGYSSIATIGPSASPDDMGSANRG
jgi:hypothetical protein